VRAQLLVGPGRFTEVEVPAPGESDLAAGQVLLRVLAGGICGSDLPLVAAGPPADGDIGWGRTFGAAVPLHEVVGEVVATRHADHRPGDRVVGWASGFDALAEYAVTEGDGVAAHDHRLEPTTAVLLQPLACVLHALHRVTGLAGTSAAVIGLGPIGLLFTHALRALGATTVVGVDPVDRRDVAARFGLSGTVAATGADWAGSLADADRPDLVVEAVGHNPSTLNAAVDAVRPGGQIYCFGIPDAGPHPFDLRGFLRKNLRLTSGVTTERRHALATAARYLAEHPDLVDGYVTDVLPLDRTQAAFERALRPEAGRLKVALRMA
jgi:threonine dehydrogenase-like Zn-dependent dehydrogenase